MLRGVWLGLFVCCGGIVAMMLCEMIARFDNLLLVSPLLLTLCALCVFTTFSGLCAPGRSRYPRLTHGWRV